MSVKREKGKSEKIWRKSKLVVHSQIFLSICQRLKTLIRNAKESYFKTQISDCQGDQKQLFSIVNSLMGREKQTLYPQHKDSLSLATLFNDYFVTKISDIRKGFPDLEIHSAPFSISNFSFETTASNLSHFTPTTIEEVKELLSKMNKTTCILDPFPTKFLFDYSDCFVDVIVHIINLCFTSGVFPLLFKAVIVKPLLKKTYS